VRSVQLKRKKPKTTNDESSNEYVWKKKIRKGESARPTPNGSQFGSEKRVKRNSTQGKISIVKQRGIGAETPTPTLEQ